MKYYTVKEASEILGISIRAVQKRCIKNNIWKKSNCYQITEENIKEWRTTNEPNEQLVRLSTHNKELTDKISEQNELIKELKKNLAELTPNENEVIELFTLTEYKEFEMRLNEWVHMQREIKHQSEKHEIEKKSLSEQLDFFKYQYEYQRLQSEKMLEIHQKLIDTVQAQAKLQIQRNVIEATEKGVK